MQDIVKHVSEFVDKARAAQKIAEAFTQEEVDYLVTAIAWGIGGRKDIVHELALSALEESGLGDYDSKVAKISGKARALLYELKDKKSVGIVEINEKTGLTRIVKPIGVIASLVPSTQPEMHPLVQAMNAIKSRNAMVFSPHPSGKETTVKTVNHMRDILKKHGAPEDLLLVIDEPTLEKTNELMRQVDLIIATGGAPMVKAAHSMGKPAYGVGAGNAIMIVDETADIMDAAQKIKTSKVFDLAAGCSCDNSVIIHESVYDELLDAFRYVGAYLATDSEKIKIQSALWPNWPEDRALNRELVCKPVQVIAEKSGIHIPMDRQFILVEEDKYAADTPFAGEKMCLVLTLYRYKNFDDAIRILNINQAYSGAGHSCGIYSKDEGNIERLALESYTTRVNVNLANSASNTGSWFNSMPVTSSLGCGTWGGNIISENLALKHYLNNTWVISAIAREQPTDEELFGEFMHD